MATPHSSSLVERAAQWLYKRIMEERVTWTETHGAKPAPKWKDLDELNKGYWREHAQDMLIDIGMDNKMEE